MSPLDFALDYIHRGWAVVPVPFKSKRPAGDAWRNLRITEADVPRYFNGATQNVGVRLGELSGGLADTDLDTAEANSVAGYFLQPTLCFGRASKPRSHWLYQSDLWQTEDKAAIQFKFATGRGNDRKEQMVLELRIGGGDKAAQTVFPGSVHETGELIAWDDAREAPAKAEGDSLKQRCARAAAAALLAAHFPSKGARHDAGLTLGGFLFRCEFLRPDAELFAEAVTIASGQPMEKVKDVRKAVREAWDEGKRDGGRARGFPALAETFGDDVAKHVAKWLGYEGARGNCDDRDESYFPPGEPGSTGAFPYTAENTRKLRDALSYIPADGRDMWLKVGGALNSLGPEWSSIAREIWDEWSQTEPGSFDAEDQVATWEGFDPARPGGATVRTIFFEATERGWKPRIEVNSEAFFRNRPQGDQKPPSRVIGAGTFLRSYEPISYTIDGVLPSGYLYGLTGRQGTGKTAFMQASSIAVAMSRPEIIGCDIEPGRVAYVTIENPIDFKMKLAVNCFIKNITYAEIETRVAIIDGRDTPEQIYAGLKLDAKASGPFQLVCFDTFQAGFAAANAGAFNENEAVLKYVGRLRPLTMLPGSPSVLVAFHPIKNATEDDLFPYGGGATMNEIDGNLTLWNAAQIKLHWNRVRGPQFEPKYFRIEKMSCPDILDNKGRQILLPVMRPCTEMDVEEKTTQEGNSQLALLKAIIENPTGSQREWAFRIGKSQGAVGFLLKKLGKAKLVSENFGKWRPTKKGTEAAQEDLFGQSKPPE